MYWSDLYAYAIRGLAENEFIGETFYCHNSQKLPPRDDPLLYKSYSGGARLSCAYLFAALSPEQDDVFIRGRLRRRENMSCNNGRAGVDAIQLVHLKLVEGRPCRSGPVPSDEGPDHSTVWQWIWLAVVLGFALVFMLVSYVALRLIIHKPQPSGLKPIPPKNPGNHDRTVCSTLSRLLILRLNVQTSLSPCPSPLSQGPTCRLRTSRTL